MKNYPKSQEGALLVVNYNGNYVLYSVSQNNTTLCFEKRNPNKKLLSPNCFRYVTTIYWAQHSQFLEKLEINWPKNYSLNYVTSKPNLQDCVCIPHTHRDGKFELPPKTFKNKSKFFYKIKHLQKLVVDQFVLHIFLNLQCHTSLR